MKAILQFLRPVLMMFVFIIVAGLLLLILESVLGSDLIGAGGRLVYVGFSVVLFAVYMRKRIQQENLRRDYRDGAEKAKSSSEEDTHEQASLEEVRERIRRRKIEAGERG